MKQILTFSILILCTATAKGQSIGPSELNTTGSSATAGGNTYEYAIGGVTAGNTFASPTLIVTPGVLQPVLNQTSGVDQPGISITDLNVFPNPVEEILFLQPAFGKKGKLSYVLADASGRIIARKEIGLEQGNERQQVRMSSYAAGQYTLNVIWQQQDSKFGSAYKIQKVR